MMNIAFWTRNKKPRQRTYDPVTGDLIITPEMDLAIRKALVRAVRRMAFEAKCQRYGLDFRIFLYKMKALRLKIMIEAFRRLHNLKAYWRAYSPFHKD